MLNVERKPSKVERYKKPVGVGVAVTGLIIGGVPGTLAAIIGTAAYFYPIDKEKSPSNH